MSNLNSLRVYTADEIKDMPTMMIQELAHDKMLRAKIQLQCENPFFGAMAAYLKLKLKVGLGTFATDGDHLVYDPESALLEDERFLQFVIMHEVAHNMMQHLTRKGTRTALIDNDGKPYPLFYVAADYAIHSLFDTCNYYFDPRSLFDAKYNGLSTEEIYDLLLVDAEEAGGAPLDGDGDGNGEQGFMEGLGGKPIDSHDEWEDAGKEAAKQKQNGYASEDSLEEKWKDRMNAATQAAKSAGKMPAALENFISEMMKSKIDWKTALRRYVNKASNGDYTWSRPSRRSASIGCYLPGQEGETIHVACYIDTSGSVSDQMIHDFLGETFASINHVQAYQIHVSYFEAEVYLTESFSENETMKVPTNLQRGGTNFQKAFDHIHHDLIPKNGKPDVILFFTDGYDSWPTTGPGLPILAVVDGPTHEMPSYCTVLKYESTDS